MVEATADWRDPAWLIKGDTAWARRLRRHQGWWRQTQANFEAGPAVTSDRLVVSMLPVDIGLQVNLMTHQARVAYAEAMGRLRETGAPGLIQQERLRRNLLSSQPLCFNLFGHLSQRPAALLPWVRRWSPGAAEVTRIELEYAPPEGTFARSAFDAYIEYKNADGHLGFLGVECKYAEDLTASQRAPAAPKFAENTRSDEWRAGATEALDRNGLRQLWYNTLLGQHMLRTSGAVEGSVLVVALSGDVKARQATQQVADQLIQPAFLDFAPIEDILECIEEEDEWRRDFSLRYTELEHSA